MRTNFEKGMSWIRTREGWKGGAPNDPGGETICGISFAAHPEAVKAMRPMTEEQAWKYASNVYLTDYWVLGGCDDLPWPQDIVRFDSMVQSYFGWTKDWADTQPDMYHFLLRRLMHYEAVDKGEWKNRGGWVNRIADLARLIEKS